MNQSLKEKHDKIKDKNRVLIRENMKLYRQLRILRLKLKDSQLPTQEKTSLETLANLATTMVDIVEQLRGGGGESVVAELKKLCFF